MEWIRALGAIWPFLLVPDCLLRNTRKYRLVKSSFWLALSSLKYGIDATLSSYGVTVSVEFMKLQRHFGL